MRIAAQSRQQIVAQAREQYRQALGSAPAPDLRNAGAVEDLDAPLHFTYRGVRFVAQPTPHADGVALLAWQTRVKALPEPMTSEAMEEYGALLASAVERFRRLARPVRWLDRVRFGRRNPFAGATEAEIGWLVGFFSTCRMIARVRHAARN